ncbi:MAG: LURP-one-related/scramblase family protein [Nocardioides sp.]
MAYSEGGRGPADAPSLSNAPLVVVDQVTSFLSNNFVIANDEGWQIGEILTSGSLGSRFLLGSRQLTVMDRDGAFVFIDDVVNLGLDTYQAYDGKGERVGTIVKRFTFFSLKLSVSDATGAALAVAGDLMSRHFEVTDSAGQSIARVARSFPGLAEMLLGRNRYAVAFARQATTDQRRLVLGCTVAIDLIRAKQRNSSSGVA